MAFTPRLHSSFKGAGFLISETSIPFGRDAVVHEFTHRDIPYVEDMGGKSVYRNVTAYIATANCSTAEVEARAAALMAACSSYGPGPLVLGRDGVSLALCLSCTQNRYKDVQNYLAFDLEFVDAAGLPAPAPIGLFVSRVIGLVSTIASRSRSVTRSNLVSTQFTQAAQDGLHDAIATFTPLLGGAVVNADITGKSRRSADEALQFVAGFADEISEGRVDEDRNIADSAPSIDNATVFFPEYQEVLLAIRDGDSVTGRLEALEELSLIDVPKVFEDSSVSSIEYETVRQGALHGLKVMSVAHYAAAALERRFENRRLAITQRGRLVETSDLVKPLIDDKDLFSDLQRIVGQSVEGLSANITDLAPIITVTASKSLPSLYWSNRIYGTADKAAELVERNNVAMSFFMPTEFEAEAIGGNGVRDSQRAVRRIQGL